MASIVQKKLWKAYGKVAKVLGEENNIFRSSVLDQPMLERNWIGQQNVAFSQDDKYSKPNDQGLSLWNCWIDGNADSLFDIQQGDHIKNMDTGVIYYIASTQSHLPIRAILTTNIIQIEREDGSTYTNSGTGYGPSAAQIALDVPCYIIQPSSKSGDLGYIPVPGNASDALPNYEIHFWDPDNTVSIKDKITDNYGNTSQVMVVYKSDIGTKIITRAYSAR